MTTWKCPDKCRQLPCFERGHYGDHKFLLGYECPDDLGADEVCPMGIMPGKLYTVRMGLKYIPKCDYYLLATRYVKITDRRVSYLVEQVKQIPGAVFFHEPTLAPTKEVFDIFSEAVQEGEWEEDAFILRFEPAFIPLMEQEPMKSSIDDIKNLLNDGKNVCILCYCWKDKICHRSLIAQEIRNCGYSAYEFGEASYVSVKER